MFTRTKKKMGLDIKKLQNDVWKLEGAVEESHRIYIGPHDSISMEIVIKAILTHLKVEVVRSSEYPIKLKEIKTS